MKKLRDMLAHVAWLSGRVACVVRWEWWSEEVVDVDTVKLDRSFRIEFSNSWEVTT